MKRVLIVRTSAIGDVVFASPFAAAIKRSHPKAHVAWLVEPGIHELLAADPAIDELILWPKAEWKQLWKEKLYVNFSAVSTNSATCCAPSSSIPQSTCRACSRVVR